MLPVLSVMGPSSILTAGFMEPVNHPEIAFGDAQHQDKFVPSSRLSKVAGSP